MIFSSSFSVMFPCPGVESVCRSLCRVGTSHCNDYQLVALSVKAGNLLSEKCTLSISPRIWEPTVTSHASARAKAFSRI
jgi:hypothetical protein